jgi:hypothetical protein
LTRSSTEQVDTLSAYASMMTERGGFGLEQFRQQPLGRTPHEFESVGRTQ